MAHFLTLLLVLLFAAFSPNNLASTLKWADYSFTNDSVIQFFDEERNIVRRSNDISRCLDNDRARRTAKVFCTRIRNYPATTHLEKLIKKKYSNTEPFFGKDFIMTKNSAARTRTRDNSENELLCRSRVRVIYPVSAMNKEYNWMVVVNLPNYKQGIRIEECLGHGQVCGKENGISLPYGFVATCEQHYIYRNLIGYKNDEVVMDAFRIPSCCKCVLRRCYKS